MAGDRRVHDPGALAGNVTHFGRVLRGAGLPVGTGQILDAIRALARVDIEDREQFYWALHASLVSDHRHDALFDQAFRLYWKHPAGMAEVLAALLPRVERPEQAERGRVNRRVADALRSVSGHASPGGARREVEIDAAMTYSGDELLRTRDFAEMSAEEIRRARQLIATMNLVVATVPTRRLRADPRGRRVDMRGTLRATLRTGGATIPLRWRSPRERPPALIILCDISGSMERYSHMLLHFIHAVTSRRERVHSFVFGTRLSNITRHLARRDVDVALARVGQAVDDWAGGTRIGACLVEFNRSWSRRVLGQGAVILLITDGLDRDPGPRLEHAMDRLHRSCSRLIWLNPLLRYEGFEPRARGIRAMLPHVDEFRPVHDLDSLDGLARALATPART